MVSFEKIPFKEAYPDLREIRLSGNIYIQREITPNTFRTIKAKKAYHYRLGNVYEYQIRENNQLIKTKYTVFTPLNYQIPIVDGKYCIPHNPNSEFPLVPLGCIPDIPAEEYNLLLKTHLSADTVRTIKKGFNIPLWLIIVAVIIIAGVIGYNALMSNKSGNTGNTTSPAVTMQER